MLLSEGVSFPWVPSSISPRLLHHWILLSSRTFPVNKQINPRSSVLTCTHSPMLLDSRCPAPAVHFFASFYIRTDVFCTPLSPVPVHFLFYIHSIQNFTATILLNLLLSNWRWPSCCYIEWSITVLAPSLFLVQSITSSSIGFLHLVLRTPLFKFSFCVTGSFFSVFAVSSTSPWLLHARMPPYLSLKSSAVVSRPWAPGLSFQVSRF